MALVSKYEAAIMDALNLCGQVTINDLAVQLGVSGETVRRHVDPLVKRGLALRVHGGIIAPISTQEAPFHSRLAKRRLAKAASELIKDGDSLIIDCGSTTAYVAQALCDHSSLNVVTNSIEIARTLASRNGNRTYVTGGELRPDDAAALVRGQSILSSSLMSTMPFCLLALLIATTNSWTSICVRQNSPELQLVRLGRVVLLRTAPNLTLMRW